MQNKDIYILAIESSCDDTSAAVLKNDIVLSNIVANQIIHQKYGGVVPELASRAHQQNIVPVVHQAIEQAGITKKQLSAIAFTRGPGLMGSLLVGTSFATTFAMALDIPFIDVNHMQAHILAHFIKTSDKNNITSKPKFPFICLTISGGHTQLVQVNSYFDFKILGETTDDAAGEAFDKSAKILGLQYPGGPLIDKLAKKGNPKAFPFPIPKTKKELDFSFSGFKTAVLRFIQKNTKENHNFIKENLEDICASIQNGIVSILIKKIEKAVSLTGINQIAIAGGVSANSEIRKQLTAMANKKKWDVFIPPFEYTTDNAAMIGIVGYLKLKNNFKSKKNNHLATARLKVNEN
jgi:N6-L-threonylcarbamoyladenine synthase